ncbi:MAG: shikimate dehydrogenase [Microbacterium sp.]
MTTVRNRLAVWGDPIAHSRSPQLHAAAYALLGLDWEYGRRRVDAGGFSAAVEALDGSWRGLSLTMPLKEAARAHADSVDEDAALTGAVNTLLLGERNRGFNTDVAGLAAALADAGLGASRRARILGAGATARSTLVSLLRLGVENVEVMARRPEQIAELIVFGERIGLACTAAAIGEAARPVDLTVSTLPGSAVLPDDVTRLLARNGGALFSAAYAPWPTALAAAWTDAPVVTGLEMLLHQAVLQIRIFLHGDAERALPDERAVLAVMRDALAMED